MKPALPCALGLAAAVAFAPLPALCAEPIVITIKDHKFTPDAVAAPAGQRIQLTIVNQDGTPEEFESRDLRVEKFVAPKGRITVTVAPRGPGAYAFFGDFHPETAKGVLTLTGPR